MRRPLIAALVSAVLSIGLGGCSALGSAQPAEVGDCVQIGDTLEGTEVDGVPTLDCGEEHDGQVVHMFDLPDGNFPNPDEVLAAVTQRCSEGFEEFVGIPFEESRLALNWLSPLEEGWDAGDRSVQCVAYFTDETTTESFEDAKI